MIVLRICLTFETRTDPQNKIFRVFAAGGPGKREGTGGLGAGIENGIRKRKRAKRPRLCGTAFPGGALGVSLGVHMSFKSWTLLLRDSGGPDYRLRLGGNNEDK